MQVSHLRARHGEIIRLDDECLGLNGGEPAVVVIVAESVRAPLAVRHGLSTAWTPLQQAITLFTADGQNRIEPGTIRVTSPDERPRLSARERSSWIALIGNAAAWECAFGSHFRGGLGCLPLPTVTAIEGLLRDSLEALLCDSAHDMRPAACAAEDILVALGEAQRGAIALATACPGRSHATRLQVLQRLLRVKLRIDQGDATGIELKALGRIASYSASHLARVFHKVFGVPPYEYALRERMRRALDLLGDSRLAVSEVAQALGATSHSAFSRQFRTRFGQPASKFRQQLHGASDAVKDCAFDDADSGSVKGNDFLTYGTCRSEAAAFSPGEIE